MIAQLLELSPREGLRGVAFQPEEPGLGVVGQMIRCQPNLVALQRVLAPEELLIPVEASNGVLFAIEDCELEFVKAGGDLVGNIGVWGDGGVYDGS